MIDKTTTQSIFKDNPDFETTDWPLIVEMMYDSLNGDAEEQKIENYVPEADLGIDDAVRWARIIKRDLDQYKDSASHYKHLYESVKANNSSFELKKCRDELSVFKDLYSHEKEANRKLREEITRAYRIANMKES